MSIDKTQDLAQIMSAQWYYVIREFFGGEIDPWGLPASV